MNFVKNFTNRKTIFIFNKLSPIFLWPLNLSPGSYLFKIKLLVTKKLIRNQIIYKSKSCRAAEFSKFCKFSIWFCLYHRWLSWRFADWSSWLREPLILFDGNWVLHRSVFPRKEEIVEWLSHISRVRSFGVIHSHMLSHTLHHLHFSKLVLCDGYLRHMSFVEISLHLLHHVPDLDWDVHSGQKHSRDCFSNLNLY